MTTDPKGAKRNVVLKPFEMTWLEI